MLGVMLCLVMFGGLFLVMPVLRDGFVMGSRCGVVLAAVFGRRTVLRGGERGGGERGGNEHRTGDTGKDTSQHESSRGWFDEA